MRITLSDIVPFPSPSESGLAGPCSTTRNINPGTWAPPIYDPRRCGKFTRSPIWCLSREWLPPPIDVPAIGHRLLDQCEQVGIIRFQHLARSDWPLGAVG